MQILQGTNNTTIEPVSLSEALDLSGHAFDYAVVKRWGDYELVCCQDYTNAEADPFNSVMYIRNVVSGAWDKLSAFVLNGRMPCRLELEQRCRPSSLDYTGSARAHHERCRH
jgi:hypothetical protein